MSRCRGIVVTLLLVGTGMVCAADEMAVPVSIPLQIRRHLDQVTFRFLRMAPAQVVETAVIQVVEDPAGVVHEQGTGTSVVSLVEAHLLVSQLQADGFFDVGTVVSTAATGVVEGVAGIIELQGFDDRGGVAREVLFDREVWQQRLSALANVLGGRAAPGLCDACRGLISITSVGACKRCGRTTRSGAFPLCTACALAGGRCERCERPLPVGASSLLRQLAR